MTDVNDQLWGGPLDGRSLKALGLEEEDLKPGLQYNALSLHEGDKVVIHQYDLGSLQYQGQLETCGIEWEGPDPSGDGILGHICVMPTEHGASPCTCLCGEVDDDGLS